MSLTGETVVLPERMYLRKNKCMNCGASFEFDLREKGNMYKSRFCSGGCQEEYLSP